MFIFRFYKPQRTHEDIVAETKEDALELIESNTILNSNNHIYDKEQAVKFINESNEGETSSFSARIKIYNINDDNYCIYVNKKTNATYWDIIDDDVETLITNIMRLSLTNVTTENTADYDDIKDAVIDAAYNSGIVPQIRDLVVDFLEEHNGYFPFVDKPM